MASPPKHIYSHRDLFFFFFRICLKREYLWKSSWSSSDLSLISKKQKQNKTVWILPRRPPSITPAFTQRLPVCDKTQSQLSITKPDGSRCAVLTESVEWGAWREQDETGTFSIFQRRGGGEEPGNGSETRTRRCRRRCLRTSPSEWLKKSGWVCVCVCLSHVCVLVYCFVIGGEHQCIWPQPKEWGDKSDVPAEVAYVFNLNINVTFCDYLSIKTGSTDVFPNSG